jgi:hypothetical protein
MMVHRFLLVAGIAALLALGFVAFAQAESGLQSPLTAISGQGVGHVDVSPTAEGQGAVFIAQGEAEIHGALPYTPFEVQRAVDFTPNDGVCTIAPSPPAGWITLATFTTSNAGTGAAHFVRNSPPPGPPGFQFDLILRVISNDGTQILQSECMTVTVK